MPVYETTFVINPQTDDATIDSQVSAITDLITQNDGKIVYEDRMGTRRLAYEVEGLTQGYYASLYYEGNAAIPPILERFMRLEEPYVRHLTIIYEGDVEKLGQPVEGHDFGHRDRRPHHGRGGGRRRDDRPAPGRDRAEKAEEKKPAEQADSAETPPASEATKPDEVKTDEVKTDAAPAEATATEAADEAAPAETEKADEDKQ